MYARLTISFNYDIQLRNKIYLSDRRTKRQSKRDGGKYLGNVEEANSCALDLYRAPKIHLLRVVRARARARTSKYNFTKAHFAGAREK